MDIDGDLVTPLVNNRECAYVYFAEDGGKDALSRQPTKTEK